MSILAKTLLPFIFLLAILHNSEGQFEDYCVADEQTVEEQLAAAMDWACRNGADCRPIQAGAACHLPDTIKDHASFAFNSYYQKMKSHGGSCYFNAAAVLTATNPSHDSCKYEYLP
ncbi:PLASMODESMATA CALLOSE-BINDING PROTEIN 5 [Andrographis paniculata]|uniref:PLASMODESMATA CALLOSE-BINDING PROTEIN 5 n=1 Tax=Andrographis paniculata TaxID=175694 RepID=UPI0021E87917|nr:PLASMODESMATA CALLOSE-BINDING PROTEIN 5 [Andrographis paniculata]